MKVLFATFCTLLLANAALAQQGDLNHLDRNHDQLLNKKEFMSGVGRGYDFEDVDINNDHLIDASEWHVRLPDRKPVGLKKTS